MRMKVIFYILFILSSVFFISCEKEYTTHDINSIDIQPTEKPYNPEKDLPKEIKVYGKYTLTKNNKSFQFDSEDRDWYCYKIKTYTYPSDEDIVSIRFRLYDKNNKLLHDRIPFTNETGRKFIMELYEKYPEDKIVTVWTHIPYHKNGVKIKAVLVDDTGKDLRVLAEREILAPEEFRKRSFYEGCYREIGFRRQ